MGIPIKLGFFLHIPFPPRDIFRLLPWADEVLEGLLGISTLENKNMNSYSRIDELKIEFTVFIQLAFKFQVFRLIYLIHFLVVVHSQLDWMLM